MFGQDGTGGYVAFWLIRPGQPLVEQLLVFLGSEGETGVVARNLAAFLRLLADGFGPWEASTSHCAEPDWIPRPHHELRAVAERFAPDHGTLPTNPPFARLGRPGTFVGETP